MPDRRFGLTPFTTPLTLPAVLGIIISFAPLLRSQELAKVAVDPKIAGALKDISADRIQANIVRLVAGSEPRFHAGHG